MKKDEVLSKSLLVNVKNKIQLKERISLVRKCGYGDDVYIVQTHDKKKYVLKVFNEFSPFKQIPLYNSNRLFTEVEVYEKLNLINPKIKPELLEYNQEMKYMILEYIDKPYKLLVDYINEKKEINKDVFDEFIDFFINKRAKSITLENVFYTQKTTLALRMLFVEKKHLRRAKTVFERSSKKNYCLNIASLSPKNIFINYKGSKPHFKIIDFEESFIGDPMFDPAFFVGHLLLYSIANEDQSLRNNISEFTKKLARNYTIDQVEKEQLISYAGLMLLHRANGFNLPGQIQDHNSKFIEIGEEMLYGNDTLNLL